MEKLYPLKFETIYKDKIWGGNKIHTVLGKDFSPLPNCGETWEVSAVKGNVSRVANGPLKGKLLTELIEQYKEQLVGDLIYKQYGNDFPLLVKFIDAADDLSIQVHPNDKLAAERHSGRGKTEMWYVLAADKGAELISGFNRAVDKPTYLKYFESGHLTEILNREKVKATDCFYLPAGRVHSIGRGILLAEIQQSSDTTYRIYDFDRVDDQGNPRQLHTELAVDAIDYNYYPGEYKVKYEPKKNEVVTLVEGPYFATKLIEADRPIDRHFSQYGSFVILTCTQGCGTIHYEEGDIEIKAGECLLIPACLTNFSILPSGEIKILESFAKA